MAQKPVPQEESERRRQALAASGGNVTAAARSLDIPRQTMQSWASQQSGFAVKGTSTLHDAEGNVVLEWVKTREDALSVEEMASQVREALEGFTPPPAPSVALSGLNEELATVYPCADWHVGLLSWKKETGGPNYDIKIGSKLIKETLDRLFAVTPNSTQAVILGLGDLLHSDSYRNATTKDTPQDVDGRYPKLLYAATDLILYTVELALQKHQNVLLRLLPGNHDEQSAIAVTLAVKLYYANNERVTVDDDAGRFWWWSWGKVFLGATHGDKTKMQDLPLLMAARNPQTWGSSKFRHIYTGHIHTQTGIDKGTVTVESFQVPVPADSYHHQHGYGAQRSCQAITHHQTLGEIMRHRVNIV